MSEPGLSGHPPLRRVLLCAGVALAFGLAAVAVLAGFSSSTPLRVLEAGAVFVSGILIVGGGVVLALVRLAGWRQAEPDFERLVQRSERLAADEPDAEDFADAAEEDDAVGALDPYDEDDFRALVRSALDDLPLDSHRALEHVAVVVSDGGRKRHAYGMYEGDTVARDHFHERILIFRDTLTRDFGHDPDLLRAQVIRTVRHELAHHLGWDERGVRGLGL